MPGPLRIVFIGRNHQFSLLPLKRLMCRHKLVGIVESAERPDRRRRTRLEQMLRSLHEGWRREGFLLRLAKSHRIPFLALDANGKPRLEPLLRALQPDLVCVASLTHLLRPEVLAIPRLGFINLHPSLLPRYHGPFPWFWQYHDFRLELGATVHEIDCGQDTGRILRQQPVQIPLGADIQLAMRLVTEVGARLMADVADDLAAGRRIATAHDPAAWPKARIVRRSERFIDWKSWTLERTYHFLCGTLGWVDHLRDLPGANGKDLVPIGFLREISGHAPGTIHADPAGWFVAHHEGVIRLRRQAGFKPTVLRLLRLVTRLRRDALSKRPT